MLNPPFKLFDTIQAQLQPGHLFVEIGSDRGSGSARYLQNLANATGNSYVTIDIDPVFVGNDIKSYVMSGEDWAKNVLPTLGKNINLVLMDNCDWIDSPFLVRNGKAGAGTYNLIAQYAQKGIALSNVTSSLAHMSQTLDMLPHLADQCAILFCDTWFNSSLDTFEGKGAGAVYLLLAVGFTVLSASKASNYVLLGRQMGRPATVPYLDLTALSTKVPGANPDTVIFKNDH